LYDVLAVPSSQEPQPPSRSLRIRRVATDNIRARPDARRTTEPPVVSRTRRALSDIDVLERVRVRITTLDSEGELEHAAKREVKRARIMTEGGLPGGDAPFPPVGDIARALSANAEGHGACWVVPVAVVGGKDPRATGLIVNDTARQSGQYV
jgi:hypothetical protein